VADVARVLKRMPKQSQHVLVQWCAWFPPHVFYARLVTVLVKVATNRLQAEQRAQGGRLLQAASLPEEVQGALELLSVLQLADVALHARLNSLAPTLLGQPGLSVLDENAIVGRFNAAGSGAGTARFNIPRLESLCDLKTDYLAWRAERMRREQRGQDLAVVMPFSLCAHPHLISALGKASILSHEQELAKQQSVLSAMSAQAVLHPLRADDPVNSPFLVVSVRREQLLADAARALLPLKPHMLRKPLKVVFQGEEGVDSGGLSSEFLRLSLTKLAHDPALFVYDPDTRLLRVEPAMARKGHNRPSLNHKRLLPAIRRHSFRLFGVLIGLACYSQTNVLLPFPPAFWKQMLALPLTLADLAHADPSTHAGLQRLLAFAARAPREVEGTFGLSFSVEDKVLLCDVEDPVSTSRPMFAGLAHGFLEADTKSAPIDLNLYNPNHIRSTELLVENEGGTPVLKKQRTGSTEVKADISETVLPIISDRQDASEAKESCAYVEIELVPGGAELNVDGHNATKYCELYAIHVLRGRVQPEMEAIVQGFRDICEGYALDLLLPDDLEHIVCGAPALQLADLQSVTLYEGFTPRDPVVVWFWETVLAFTHDQKEAFLVFVTGSARCPIGGLSQLHLKVQRAGPDSESLPTASTCFHVLLLPAYRYVNSYCDC